MKGKLWKMVCAWCGKEIGWSEVPDSHGICDEDAARMLGISESKFREEVRKQKQQRRKK